MIVGYGTLKEEKLPHLNLNHVYSNASICSASQHSTTSGEHFSPKSSNIIHAGSTTKIGNTSTLGAGTGAKHHGSSEDLYSWMAKQQDYIRDKLRRDPAKKDKVSRKDKTI